MSNQKSDSVSYEGIPQQIPVPSRDMFPSEEFLSVYPEMKNVLMMDEITSFFNEADAQAIIKKRVFVRLGTVSLILVAIVLILLSWRLSLSLVSISFPFWIELFSSTIGLSALFIQIYLFFKGSHQNWLYCRYMAEKSRLWKFQLLLDGRFISAYLEDPLNLKPELRNRFILFKEQFKHGLGGMNEFIESEPLELMTKPTSYAKQEIVLKIKEIYLMLRLDVQITHFSDQNIRLAVVDGLTDSWAKVLLGVSGVLAVLEACLLGLQAAGAVNFQSNEFKVLTAALAGISLTFAIASAAIRVYRSASAVAEDRERYRSKQNHLKRIKDYFKETSDPAKILDLMEEAENVCNEELQEFLISLRRADYFF